MSDLPPICDRYLPRVHEIQPWPPTGVEQLKFRIREVAYQDAEPRFWNHSRFIYHAETGTQHKEVLVKFTRRYCHELHDFCAQRDHAPKLLGYGTVPGGWKVVVMEHVKHNYDRTSLALKYWATWERDLTRLMQEFHEQGFVHGDLRDANFIVPTARPNKIMLIDFDWGGEAGKVHFPTWLLDEELMNGRMESLVITKEHDIRVLTAALKKLRPVDNVIPPPNPPTRSVRLHLQLVSRSICPAKVPVGRLWLGPVTQVRRRLARAVTSLTPP